MRKILSKVLLLSCALLFLSFNNVKATSSEETNVTNTIHSYFTNEMNSIKDFKVHDSEDLISNSDLKDYDETKNNYYSEWYKGINYKLKSYNIDLKYSNLNINKDTASVDVENDSSMIFENAPNINQRAISKYSVVLKKINDQWKIQDILSLNEEDNTNTQKVSLTAGSNNKINYKKLKEQFSNVQADLKSREEQNEKDKEQSQLLLDKAKDKAKSKSKKVSLSAVDGGYIAAAYAEKWYNSYNPDFPSYSSDCTNFVSQCLNWGGIGQDQYFWFCVKNTSSVSSIYRPWNVTRSWISVDDFYVWLMGDAGPGHESNKYICNRGDVLQLYSTYYNCWHHSALVTVKDYTGVYYSAHSDPKIDYNLDNVYPSSNYSNCRIIGINY